MPVAPLFRCETPLPFICEKVVFYLTFVWTCMQRNQAFCLTHFAKTSLRLRRGNCPAHPIWNEYMAKSRTVSLFHGSRSCKPPSTRVGKSKDTPTADPLRYSSPNIYRGPLYNDILNTLMELRERVPYYVTDDASEVPPTASLSFFFLGALKHRYSIAVTRLVSWRVRLTPSSSLCRSPSAPGRRWYAFEMVVYISVKVLLAGLLTY